MFTWGLMGPGHDLLPRLVNLVEPLGLLWPEKVVKKSKKVEKQL